jgi:hypothetical protein
MKRTIRLLGLSGFFAAILMFAASTPFTSKALASGPLRPQCDDGSSTCAEVFDSIGYN